MIDETLPVPFHVQLSDILRDRIQAGDWEYRLPSINTLVQEYQIGRNTVLTALDTLKAEGLITAVHGKGFYIVKQR